MLEPGDKAPGFSLTQLDGAAVSLEADTFTKPRLLVFFETDCPTCRLAIPYLNRLSRELKGASAILGISQDGEAPTRALVEQAPIEFPVALEHDLSVTKLYDPVAVPTLFLVGSDGLIAKTLGGFDKQALNGIASAMAGRELVIAAPFDGAPDSKYGCTSRHLETAGEGELAAAANPYVTRAARASRSELDDSIDPFEYCSIFGDPLPVIPPTVERVDRMLAACALSPDEVVALIPPNYGAATVEKIAANAVMAGCKPEMMRVLIPLARAVCDERFNIHGVQATTHFAAPLVIVNGPVRQEMGFACAGNVFSNIARANSTLGRALQLILTNLGGARPGEIDMSTLGNPGKFSYCIAENEEENPWEPLHVEMGFKPDQSTVSLFAGEPPHGVSEHIAREGKQVLKTISRALATVWSYRVCAGVEAMVVLCPEHVKTLHRDGFTRQAVREFLFANTGIPLRHFEEGAGEGVPYVKLYKQSVIDGEQCYLKFTDPSAIKLVVAGGTAGKFSAVIGSWAAGARGSQMVTYPIEH
ncbi:MAG TPA: TlpA disulfide reductase family protein [Blastocatellia bacterium]|nr:TlpA disulfide reductase family protein [Blastocatellia bacterium]